MRRKKSCLPVPQSTVRPGVVLLDLLYITEPGQIRNLEHKYEIRKTTAANVFYCHQGFISLTTIPTSSARVVIVIGFLEVVGSQNHSI